MFLAIDIGNTNISLGILKKYTLIKTSKFRCIKNIKKEFFIKDFKNFIQNINITDCAISSVVDEVTNIISESIETVCNIKPLIINNSMNFNLKIKAQHPEKIGTDRITNACAAKKLYSSKPAIVVDIGTATTFDILDKNGDFIGGLIIPGINTQLKSLADNTSKLPDIEIQEINYLTKTINTDTKKAILSGIVKGHAHAIEGLIEDCKKELNGKPIVIATGGNAKLISKYVKKDIFDEINPNLTLEGLYIINEFNKE